MADLLAALRAAYTDQFAGGMIPFDNVYFDALRAGATDAQACRDGVNALLDDFVKRVQESPGYQALLNVERSARELDKLFDGSPGNWTLGEHDLDEEAAAALLSLHDYLNDVTNAT